MIDFDLPIEFVDGTPARYVGRYGTYFAVVAAAAPRVTNANYYLKDGRHYRGIYKSIRNVATKTPALNLSAPLETLTGAPAVLVGRASDGRLIVEVAGGPFSPAKLEYRYPDGRMVQTPGAISQGDLRNKVTKTTVFRNLYADGTLGATEHKSLETAKYASKKGKRRMAIIELRYVNGEMTDTAMHTGCEQTRA